MKTVRELKSQRDCLLPAIGKMYGCITTGSGRHYSEVVGGGKDSENFFKQHKRIVMSENNNNRTKWLHLRLTPDEYEKIYRRYTNSTFQKLSDYARSMMLNKPVISIYRNKSLDDFMTEVIHLRNELNSIGNNINQAVKKLHTLQQIPDFRTWIITYELEKQILFNKVDEIKNRINKIADKWLQ